jgi:alkyl hydroperoxide reductase subunit F
MNTQYELIIIGGGPAGVAATVYAARKQLKTLLITKDFEGQSTVSEEIYNWIGDQAIGGMELSKKLEAHARSYAGEYLDIIDKTLVTDIKKIDDGFEVLAGDNTYTTQSVLIAAGSSRRKLPAKGADELEHKGLTYCASCDGPLFSGQDVVVIGGGNAGFESAAQLLAYTKSVTLLQRGDAYRADAITVEKVLAHPNMTGILNAETTEVLGDKFVSGLKYKDTQTGEEHQLNVTGIFVEIGQIPNTSFAKNVVELDKYNRVPIDARTQQTKTPGIWAAGDCTDVLYHQNNISAGDAVRAIEDIYVHLKTK